MQTFELPDRITATTTMAPFFQADRNHILVVGTIMGSIVSEILRSETIFQFRYTNTIDNLVWNSIAANSATLKVLKFGQSREAQEPIIRSGQNTSDARIVTAVHAVAAALTLLLPAATSTFEASLGYAILSPTVGFESTLTAACGAPEIAMTQFSAGCLDAWYQVSATPSRLGQVLAYEVMYFKIRDGWNSIGTDGACNAGAQFCPRFADVTGWQPEVGAWLHERLVNIICTIIIIIIIMAACLTPKGSWVLVAIYTKKPASCKIVLFGQNRPPARSTPTSTGTTTGGAAATTTTTK
jgi:hypothetical protein